MLSIPVSFGGFFASLANQSISPQLSNNDFVNKADGTLSMNSFKITNLATPTEENDATNKKYVDDKVVSINKPSENLDMNSLKITNLATPTEDTDAVTKAYVDKKTAEITLRLTFERIIKNYSPTFWISSRFPFGLDEDKLSIQDLTETGLTITGGAVTKSLAVNTNITIRSTALYDTEFTFFLKAKRTSSIGRLFTSSTTNKLLGWWNNFTKCAWMDGEIYGVFSNRNDNNTSSIYTFILVNNADNKTFYQDKTEIITTLDGADSWNGNIVLGKPLQNTYEAGVGQFYVVIGFNKVLTKAQIDDIYDRIFT